MSEPCDGPACPFCGSGSTLSYSYDTAIMTGFRTECRACQTRWNFPAGYPDDFGPVIFPIAAASVQRTPGGDTR